MPDPPPPPSLLAPESVATKAVELFNADLATAMVTELTALAGERGTP